MEAAAKPAKTDDYYFVVKPGTCGEHFFTDSSEEFDQAAAEYQAALRRRAAPRPSAEPRGRRTLRTPSRLGRMPQLAVVGQPISHSLSPRDADRGAAGAAGSRASGRYGAIELAPEEFAGAVERLSGDGSWAGLNVTIPHKARGARGRRAAPARPPRAIGAANTLSFHRADGRPRSRRQHRRAGDRRRDRRCRLDPAGARRAGARRRGSARAAVWALREAGADGQHLEPDFRARRRRWQRSSAPRSIAGGRAAGSRPRFDVAHQHDRGRARLRPMRPGNRLQHSRHSDSSADQLGERTGRGRPRLRVGRDRAHRSREGRAARGRSTDSRSWSAKAQGPSRSGPGSSLRWRRWNERCDPRARE